MLNDEFCKHLEWEIGKALEVMSLTDDRLKGFWCDGVLLPESESDYTKKQVNDSRFVVMTAFSGKTGQEHYELTLFFGRKALSRYARDVSLKECVPDPLSSGWFEIDPEKKRMVVQLD